MRPKVEILWRWAASGPEGKLAAVNEFNFLRQVVMLCTRIFDLERESAKLCRALGGKIPAATTPGYEKLRDLLLEVPAEERFDVETNSYPD